jgi:hypothetical protein
MKKLKASSRTISDCRAWSNGERRRPKKRELRTRDYRAWCVKRRHSSPR